MATTKTPDAGAPPSTGREGIAAILAIIDDGAARRDRVTRLSHTVGGIAVLEIVFRRHDQEVAWRAFERLLQGGHQDVQIRVDEHGWIVRVAIATEVDAAPGVSRG